MGGEAVPGRFALGGGMVEAGFGRVRGDDCGGELGEVAGPGGGSVLVGDDFELGAFGGEFEDGEEEVFAGGSVDPGGTEDDVGGSGGGEGLLAGEFGGSVDAEGVGRVGFEVGRGFGAVEDVVGGEVEDCGADLGGFLAEDAGGFGVDGGGYLGLGFGFVDGGVGGWVDDPAGVGCADVGADGGLGGEVEVGAGGGEGFRE